MDWAICLGKDFQACLGTVDRRVGRILKLLGNKDTGVFPGHAQGGLQAFFNAGADIPGVMDKDYLGAILVDELAALFAHGIWHNNFGLVAADSPYQRQANALVAAGGFDDNRVLADEPLLFRRLDHIVSCARLDGAAYIEAFKFYEYLGAVGVCHAL